MARSQQTPIKIFDDEEIDTSEEIFAIEQEVGDKNLDIKTWIKVDNES